MFGNIAPFVQQLSQLFSLDKAKCGSILDLKAGTSEDHYDTPQLNWLAKSSPRSLQTCIGRKGGD